MGTRDSRHRHAIGSRLREAAGQLGLTLRELGERIGVSSPTIYAYSTGALPISAERRRRLAELTGRSEDFFIAEEAGAKRGFDKESLKRTLQALLGSPNHHLAVEVALDNSQALLSKGDQHGAAELEHIAGKAYLAQGLYLEALEHLNLARAGFLSTEHIHESALCSQSMGYALINLGRLERARAAFEYAEKCLKPEKRWMGSVSLASLAEREGRFDEAEELLSKLNSKTDLGPDARAYAMFARASLHLALGQWTACYDLNIECLRLASDLKLHDQVLERLIQLGIASTWKGEYEEASLWLMRAVDGAQQRGDLARETYAQIAMARLLCMAGYPKEAKERCVRWLAKATEKEYRRSEALGLSLMGEITYAQRDFGAARDYGVQSAAFCETHQYPVQALFSSALVICASMHSERQPLNEAEWLRVAEKFKSDRDGLASSLISFVDAVIHSSRSKPHLENQAASAALIGAIQNGALPFSARIRALQSKDKRPASDFNQESIERWIARRSTMRIFDASSGRIIGSLIIEKAEGFVHA